MKRIESYAPAIKAGIERYIDEKRAGTYGTTVWGSDFLKRLEPFATSGKLLRGSVLRFSYEIFGGGRPDQDVLNAAIALELTHSALLIHDDIMDGDPLRRGRPSMHRQYQTFASQEGLQDAEGSGISMALAGGDAALFMAFELLGRTMAGRAPKPAPYTLYVDHLLGTCAGQMQDIYLESLPSMPSKRDIYTLMRTKTAAYTLAMPLAMGAALAGAPGPLLRRLEAIGTLGGTIFQIRDDELGVMGDPAKTGKPVGADIKEGKKTLLYLYLMKKSPAIDRSKLSRIFGNPAATAADIVYVRSQVRAQDIGRLLGDDIDRLQKRAEADISKLPLERAHKRELDRLIAFCSKRQY